MRRGAGAGLRGTIGEARRDDFLQCNAGANAAQARMWWVVTLGEARRDSFRNVMLVRRRAFGSVIG